MPNDQLPARTGGLPALSADDMAKMAGAAGTTQDFKAGDLLVPYLVIVQSTSPYIKRNDPQYIDDAREGDILNTLDLVPRSSAAFIPCKFEVHYTTWKPNRGPLVAQHFTDSTAYDAAGEGFGTRTDAEGNDIVPSAVYYGLDCDLELKIAKPVVLALQSTQYKKARRFNALIAALEMVGPNGPFIAPMFGRVYDLSTVPEHNEQGAWSGWKITPGMLTLGVPEVGQAWFQRAAEFRKAIEEGKVRPAPPPQASDSDGGNTRGGNGPNPRVLDDDSIPF